MSFIGCSWKQQGQRYPEHVSVDQECGNKVYGQAVLAYMRVVYKAALDHVPANHALQTAEHEHHQIFRPFPFADVASRGKYQEWHQEYDANQASEQSVQKFEPEYALGMNYRINNLFSLGIEAKGSADGHYVGPVIAHGKGRFWVSLGSAFNVGSVEEGKPEFQMRMLLGIGL